MKQKSLLVAKLYLSFGYGNMLYVHENVCMEQSLCFGDIYHRIGFDILEPKLFITSCIKYLVPRQRVEQGFKSPFCLRNLAIVPFTYGKIPFLPSLLTKYAQLFSPLSFATIHPFSRKSLAIFLSSFVTTPYRLHFEDL